MQPKARSIDVLNNQLNPRHQLNPTHPTISGIPIQYLPLLTGSDIRPDKQSTFQNRQGLPCRVLSKSKYRNPKHLPTAARNPYTVHKQIFFIPHSTPRAIDWLVYTRHACVLSRPCVKSDLSQTLSFFSHHYPETVSREVELIHKG